MTDFKDLQKKWLEENAEDKYSGLFDINITDKIIKTVMSKVGIEQEHIDKAKEVIDMLEFTKEDGKDVIFVNVGENVQLKITR